MKETNILTHWVNKKFKKKTLNREFVIPDSINQFSIKPTGIWISVNNSWEEWLVGNWDDWTKGKVKLTIELSKDINLFIIDSKEKFLKEFKKLTGHDYGYKKDILKEEFGLGDFDFKYKNVDKFHKELKNKYDGIMLKAEPFYRHRLDMSSGHFDYFYTWDCESICVWNTNKIISVK